LALQVTLPSPPAGKGRGEETIPDPLFAWIFWQWRVEKTRRHCSATLEASLMSLALFPSFEGSICKLTA